MTPVIATYELSPMQAGMLFYAVSGGDSGVYVEQVVATPHEPLDEAHFLCAWQRVLDRHPILRSCFRWEAVTEPVQEVIEHPDMAALVAADRSDNTIPALRRERSTDTRDRSSSWNDFRNSRTLSKTLL